MNGFIEQAVKKHKWELVTHGVLSPDGNEWVAVVKTTYLADRGEDERQLVVFGDGERCIMYELESVPLLVQFLRRVAV